MVVETMWEWCGTYCCRVALLEESKRCQNFFRAEIASFYAAFSNMQPDMLQKV
jgi:hypothetical protein